MTTTVERRLRMAAPGRKVEMQVAVWFGAVPGTAPGGLRSANRYWNSAGYRGDGLGFRVGRTLNARAGAIMVTPGAH